MWVCTNETTAFTCPANESNFGVAFRADPPSTGNPNGIFWCKYYYNGPRGGSYMVTRHVTQVVKMFGQPQLHYFDTVITFRTGIDTVYINYGAMFNGMMNSPYVTQNTLVDETVSCFSLKLPVHQCTGGSNDALYANKQRRYPEYVDPSAMMTDLLATNPEQKSEDIEEQIGAECASNCEAVADVWIKQLKKCTTEQYLLDELKVAFIDICSKGCTMGNPFGTSSIPDSIEANYHSFEEAIIGVLGISAVNDSCAVELLGNIYPHGKLPVYEKRIISEADTAVCNKLALVKSTYQSSGFSGSFHRYLLNNFPGDYNLDSLELNGLIDGCTNCNGILKNDIELPMAFEPSSKPCLACDTAQALLVKFQNKFPAVDSTEDHYETLFSNYFNYRLGFALSYSEYKTFLENCANGQVSSRLCNQPVITEFVANEELNPCTAELFATALTNANNIYVKYIDSVHRAFRDAWLTKCMSVQPQLTMTANLYEYHYTLYYYDLAGNLAKTVPPAGVQLLTDAELEKVKQYRLYNEGNCYQYSDSILFNNNGWMYFSGNEQMNAGSSPFTVEGWFNFTAFGDQELMRKEGYEDIGMESFLKGWRVNIVDGKLRVNLQSVNDSIRPAVSTAVTANLSTLVSPGAWTHIAIQRIADTIQPIRVFINGTAVALTYEADSIKNYSLSGMWSSDLLVGRFDGTTAKFTGSVRNLRLYNRSLTANEIAQQAANSCQLPVTKQGLVFWSILNEVGEYGALVEEVSRNNGIIIDPNWQPFVWQPYNGMLPAHTLTSNYQYNTLSSIVYQQTPDGGATNFGMTGLAGWQYLKTNVSLHKLVVYHASAIPAMMRWEGLQR